MEVVLNWHVTLHNQLTAPDSECSGKRTLEVQIMFAERFDRVNLFYQLEIAAY